MTKYMTKEAWNCWADTLRSILLSIHSPQITNNCKVLLKEDMFQSSEKHVAASNTKWAFIFQKQCNLSFWTVFLCAVFSEMNALCSVNSHNNKKNWKWPCRWGTSLKVLGDKLSSAGRGIWKQSASVRLWTNWTPSCTVKVKHPDVTATSEKNVVLLV